MPAPQSSALKALTDNLSAALDDLHRAPADLVVAQAEAIRTQMAELARTRPAAAADAPQWVRLGELFDRYQRVLNRRLNHTAAGLQVLGIGQPVYEPPGRGSAR
ncbi:MAG: hypothetical protein R3E83_23530 [Burkholderiaceae bacterium]